MLAAAGFAGVGALSAGFLAARPEPLRIATALLGVVALPALLLLPWVCRFVPDRSRTSTGSGLAAAAVFVLSAHAIIVQVFAVLNAHFGAYAGALTWALLASYALVAVVEVRRRGRGPRARTPVAATALVAAATTILVIVAIRVAPVYTGAEDAFDHMGHVQRIISFDTLEPDGLLAWPLGASIGMPPDPRKGAFHPIVALLCDLAGAPTESVWPVLRALMFPLAFLAFTFFAVTFTGRGALAVAAVGLFALSYSGTSFQFVNTASYGQNLAATWYWVLVPLSLGASLRGGRRSDLLFLAVVAGGGIFIHSGVALHAGILAATLILFARWLETGARAAVRVGLVLAGVAVLSVALRLGATVAREANVIHAHVQGVMFITPRWFIVSPMEVLRQYGMVFLGGLALLPATALMAARVKALRPTLSFCALPVVIAFTPPIATLLYERGSYMVFRALLNAPVFPVIALTTAAAAAYARRRGGVARIALGGLFLVWALTFLRPALDAFARDTARVTSEQRHPELDPALLAAVDGLPARSTILSDPLTSYRLSASSSHRFVAIFEQHANPCDPYALDRLQAVRDALSPFAPSTAGVAACRDYDVDFVVVSRGWHPEPGYLGVWSRSLYAPALARLRGMPECFREIGGGEQFVIFRFDPGGVPDKPWSGMTAPVTVERPPLDSCDARVPGDAFRIAGLSVHPQRVLPGDTVVVTIGYRRDAPSPFSPVPVFHLRFDREDVASQGGWPGEKYARRVRESRSGSRLRFRSDVRPGHGVFQPDQWPVGVDLCERFVVAVPPAAATGSYRVELKVERDSLLPNFDIRDLLFNRDHYSGTPCAGIEIVDRLVGGTP